jgi:phenylpropionate dioxygenase-like ring-hydroxylating dioxygenase large terminal subunit
MAADKPVPIEAHSKGVSYQDLIATDAVPPPETLRLENPIALPTTRIPITRYTSQAFHDLEMEKLWPKVWQMACREEEIPTEGDFVLYEIGRFSVIVVRTAEGIRAHHNVCLHRGRKIMDRDGNTRGFTCAFHGFSWNLDGSLRYIPSRWDFPDIDDPEFCLTPVQTGTWGGFVFINMDLAAGPLVDYLGDLPAHFAAWWPEERFIEAHVAKVMPCNWKVCQEAFMEAYHVVLTHPQLLPGIGDENTQYDVWGNFSRALTPNGTPSPHLRWAPTEQDMFDAMTDRYLDEPPVSDVPSGARARQLTAATARENLQSIVGDNVVLSDAELTDAIYYTLFPNFHPWGGYNRICYRFRPYGNNPDKSIMECYYLSPFSGERPAPAPTHWLGEDEPWTNAPELGLLARVFQQDCGNLAQVQAGLHAIQVPETILARYQETKIRHFHYLLEQYTQR